MNPWLATAVALLPVLTAAGWVAATAGIGGRLVALEFGSIVAFFMLMVLAVAYGQPSFIDLALTLAILSLPATFAYAHFLELWL